MPKIAARSASYAFLILVFVFLTQNVTNAQSKVNLGFIYELYKSKQSSLHQTQILVAEIDLLFANHAHFPIKRPQENYFDQNKSLIYKQQMTSIISAYHLGQKFHEFMPEVISVDSTVRIRVSVSSEQQLYYLLNEPGILGSDHVGQYNFSVEIDPS